VCIRFGHDWDPDCMVMDETLYQVQAKVQNYAVMYLGEWVEKRENLRVFCNTGAKTC
jgi:hypothetical protein